MKKLFIVLVFISLLACVEEKQFYKVIKVFDGDTILIDYNGKSESIRYIGVNTPEISHPGMGIDEETFGVLATEKNKELVSGKEVALEFDVQERDKYNRILAYVYLKNGDMVNEILAKEGYAYLLTYPPNIKYVEKFRTAQIYARENEKGLWSKNIIKRIPADDIETLNENIGDFVIVSGKVANTFQSKKATYLNFGKDYKTDFTIVIFKNNYESFDFDLEKHYLFKEVEISGKLKKYNGPEIILNDPASIRIIK